MAANWMIYGCRARSHHLVENPVVSVSQTQIRIIIVLICEERGLLPLSFRNIDDHFPLKTEFIIHTSQGGRHYLN